MVFQKGDIGNPTGKGGFGDHPDNRNKTGHWNPDTSLSYQLNRFKAMSLSDIKHYLLEHDIDTLLPMEIAALRSLISVTSSGTDHKEQLDWLSFIADRSEGKPAQRIIPTDEDGSTPSINITFK